jgi:hypothetical protein
VSDAWNYFNYYTEIEEQFQRSRGTGLFLMSPIDWALVESWKNSGVPLEAALRGIEVAFEKWRSKPRKRQQVNSVAYCTQAVFAEAQIIANATPLSPAKTVDAPFTLDELRAYLETNIENLRGRESYGDVAGAIERILAEVDLHYGKLEELEQRLTALEDKMSAIAKTSISDEAIFSLRRELDSSLRPYRSKMNAEQIAMLERQYLERRILEDARLPRLSLFYLR